MPLKKVRIILGTVSWTHQVQSLVGWRMHILLSSIYEHAKDKKATKISTDLQRQILPGQHGCLLRQNDGLGR